MALANEDDIDGTRRRITLSAKIAQNLGVVDGDLIELSHFGGSAALRGWARIGNTGNTLKLGPLAIAALGATPGELVECRPLKATEL